MGQFSWIKQDTKKPIRESYGCSNRNKTSAVMHDNKGNKWREMEYEGYGVFGGKDFYQLLAEMNPELAVKYGGLTGEVDHDRDIRIDIAYSGEPYLSPNLTHKEDWKWINEAPEQDPNQGWSD